MKDPIRILRLEVESLDEKLDSLEEYIISSNYDLSPLIEYEFLELLEYHNYKIGKILDFIAKSGIEFNAQFEPVVSPDPRIKFLANMRLLLFIDKMKIAFICWFYLHTQSQEILLMQIIPELADLEFE